MADQPARVVDLWFDFASTYAYPAVMLAENRTPKGVTLRWRPFLLGPIFADQGWSDSPFNLYPAKGRYMWRDLTRICGIEGLPFRQPTTFPQHSVAAARVALVGLDQGWAPAFIRTVFHRHFVEGQDIATRETLAAAVNGAGGDPDLALARSQHQDVKDRLRAVTDEARALGIFGAPTFMTSAEMFWGYDRMDQAFAWANR